jgi:hypothetical protein
MQFFSPNFLLSDKPDIEAVSIETICTFYELDAINIARELFEFRPVFRRLHAVISLDDLMSSELNYEWRILRRLDGDLSTIENLQNLATKPEKQALFPTFSIAARRILLLPIGTAGVERSFSTMNRILCSESERCRLLPDHVNYLMLISIEGPKIPDIRDGTAEEEAQLSLLTDKAYAMAAKASSHLNCTFLCLSLVV